MVLDRDNMHLAAGFAGDDAFGHGFLHRLDVPTSGPVHLLEIIFDFGMASFSHHGYWYFGELQVFRTGLHWKLHISQCATIQHAPKFSFWSVLEFVR